MMRNARMPVHELNPYLTCMLCGGYLIDATTIIQCLHSFCRTCIVHYLHTSNYCPVCECLVHKKHPHQNLRSDKTLQDVVYKVVPGLFMEEMRRRRQYYDVQTDESQRKSGRIIFSPDEKISLCVRLCTRKLCSNNKEEIEFQDKRYLLCPAQMSVSHLKKFLRLKFSLSDRLEVEMFYRNEVLKDEYNLMDVSYITGYKREKAMVLNYAFYENPNKKFKTSSYSDAVSPSNDDSGIEDENSNLDGHNHPDQNHVRSQSSSASKENDNQQQPPSDETKPTDHLPSGQGFEPAAEEEASGAVSDASEDANQDKSESKESESENKETGAHCDTVDADNACENDNIDDDNGEDNDGECNDTDKEVAKGGEVMEKEPNSDAGSGNEKEGEEEGRMKEIIKITSPTTSSTAPSSQNIPDVNDNDNHELENNKDIHNQSACNTESNKNATDDRKNPQSPEASKSVTCNRNTEVEKVQSPESNGISFEDDEGALHIVIDDSKSEKSSDDSGVQLSECSSKENGSLCSIESSSPTSVTIKVPNPEIFSLKSPVPFHNGVRNHPSKSPKTSTPFHSLPSPSGRKFPRFAETLSFNDSGYSPYRSFSDSSACSTTTSCPQTDFDADEIWTDGVMDLSKPKIKSADLPGQLQEPKSQEVEREDDSEEVEKYTYVADDLEEGDGNMVVESSYANENKTPERYSLISPDQNEVTSTHRDHVTCHAPLVIDTPLIYAAPKFTVGSDYVWKVNKSCAEVAKKSSSSGKHHKRRKSSEGSKHKVAMSKAHSKCIDVCNGHTVVRHPHTSSTPKIKHGGEKLILNQPRCEKLITSQPRREKAPNNKPRCEKLVVKLSKERNSEHYTATMS